MTVDLTTLLGPPVFIGDKPVETKLKCPTCGEVCLTSEHIFWDRNALMVRCSKCGVIEVERND